MANSYSLDLEASSSQFAAIGDGSQTGLDLSGDHTFEAWVRMESLPTSTTYMTLVSKHGLGGSYGYFWGIYNNGGTYELKGGWSANGTNFDFHSYSLSTFNTATWYHVAVAVDIASHTAYFYKDGVLLGSDATGTLTSINNNNQTFYLGVIDQGGGSGFFDGLIDEARIWSVRRTTAEILAKKQKDVTGETGLKAYWKLENDYTDASGNSNTLTGNNSPTFSSTVPFADYAADSTGASFLLNFI